MIKKEKQLSIKEALSFVKNEFNLYSLLEEFRSNKKIVLESVKFHGKYLKIASDELKADKEVVLEAVKNAGFALEYASKELKADKEIVLKAVESYGKALEYASEELKSDKEIVLHAMTSDRDALEYANKDIRSLFRFWFLSFISKNKKLLIFLVLGLIFWILINKFFI